VVLPIGVLVPRDEATDAGGGNSVEASWAPEELGCDVGHDAVLFEQGVKERHATHPGEIVERLFRSVERAVEVGTCGEVAEGLGEGHGAYDVPGIWSQRAG